MHSALLFKLATTFLLIGLISTSAVLAQELVIVHTNDFHGHIQETQKYAGAARITAEVKAIRENNEAVIFLDAGDAISGTPVSSMFEGEPIFEVMNTMGYDVGLLGNHEFDHGYRKIERFRDIAEHPLLTANAYGPDGELLGDAPYVILDIAGIAVGIIGLVTEDSPKLFSPVGNEGLTFAAPAERLDVLIPEIRPQVDVLILLAHIGHEEELALAEQFQALDVIIGGHSHTLVEQPIQVGRTAVAQAHQYGTHLGLIRVNRAPGKPSGPLQISGKLLKAKDLAEPDPRVENLVALFESKVEDEVDVQISETTRAYSKIELQPILESILAQAAGTELGFYNRRGIRDELSVGPVTARMLWNIEPFGNTLVRMRIKGKDLIVLLAQEPELHHSVPDIDPDRQYHLATNSYIASHAELAFGDDIETVDTGLLIRDILIQHIKANGL